MQEKIMQTSGANSRFSTINERRIVELKRFHNCQ